MYHGEKKKLFFITIINNRILHYNNITSPVGTEESAKVRLHAYACDQCDYTTAYNGDLKRHVNTKHIGLYIACPRSLVHGKYTM